MIKVGVTATRKGLTQDQLYNIGWWMGKNADRISELHHGMCPLGGGDFEIGEIAYQSGIYIVGHPMTTMIRPFPYDHIDIIREKKPPLERDRDIVNETEYLIVAPWQNEKPKSLKGQGTWYTENYARTSGRSKIMIYWPDGRVE